MCLCACLPKSMLRAPFDFGDSWRDYDVGKQSTTPFSNLQKSSMYRTADHCTLVGIHLYRRVVQAVLLGEICRRHPPNRVKGVRHRCKIA